MSNQNQGELNHRTRTEEHQQKADGSQQTTVKETHEKVSKNKQHGSRAADVQQLIPNVSKQQLSILVPVVLAIVLALLLLSYRGAFSFRSQPKTWKDHVSDGIQNAQGGLKEGLQEYYDSAKEYLAESSVKGQKYANEKMGETSEYLKNHASQAAKQAQDMAKAQAGKASDYAYDLANDAGAKANQAYKQAQGKASEVYESATDPNLLHRASEFIQEKAGNLFHKGQAISREAAEELRHQKNLAEENARHYAAGASIRAQENLDDMKQKVKTKIGA